MNECILVVDDDREIVGAIAIVLEREGYTVRRAYDGLGAVEQALDPAVRLILIDVMMPKLDGLSALMRIRKSGTCRSSFSLPKVRIPTRSSASPWGRMTM